MTELDDVREELEQVREELRRKDEAPLEGRVVDEDRFLMSVLRLEKRERDLVKEERRLLGDCPCEGGDDCVC